MSVMMFYEWKIAHFHRIKNRGSYFKSFDSRRCEFQFLLVRIEINGFWLLHELGCIGLREERMSEYTYYMYSKGKVRNVYRIVRIESLL